MKGLLLKEYYITIKQCKSLLFFAIIFSIISLLSADINFFSIYPCIVGGLLPLTLFSLDEKDRWCLYSAALPITKAQYVSSKYIIGLIANAAAFILTASVQAVRMAFFASFTFDNYILLCASSVAISCISPALTLPLVFKFGADKGRIIYYIVAGILGFAGAIFTINSEVSFTLNSIAGSIILMLISIALYAVSWCVSIAVYKKREF